MFIRNFGLLFASVLVSVNVFANENRLESAKTVKAILTAKTDITVPAAVRLSNGILSVSALPLSSVDGHDCSITNELQEQKVIRKGQTVVVTGEVTLGFLSFNPIPANSSFTEIDITQPPVTPDSHISVDEAYSQLKECVEGSGLFNIDRLNTSPMTMGLLKTEQSKCHLECTAGPCGGHYGVCCQEACD